MCARPTESCLLEPPSDTTKLPFQDAGSPERVQCGALGEYSSGQERSRKGSDPTRQPPRRRPDSQPHKGGKTLSFLELHAVKNSVRCHQALPEFLQHTLAAENPLVADPEVDEALVAFFNEMYRLEYSSSAGAMCHYFPECGKHGEHFLPRSHRALHRWKRSTPPRSRDPHVWCIWSVLILDFLRHGHWSMGVNLLWMVTCYFTPGEPSTILKGDIHIPIQGISSRHQVFLYPKYRPQMSKTCAANDTVVLYCPGCESLPLTPRITHGICIQLQLSRLLGSVDSLLVVPSPFSVRGSLQTPFRCWDWPCARRSAKRIQDGRMFGVRNLSRHTFGLVTSSSNVY